MTTTDPGLRTALGAGPAVVAVDVGGTDLKATIVDSDGALLEIARRPTPRDPDRPGEAVLDAVLDFADDLTALHPQVTPQALGVIVPGAVDDAAGVGVWSENLGWRDFPFVKLAGQRTGLPVGFGHDVATAGWAEYVLGAAAGFTDVLVVTVGTGIAAAVVLEGRLYRGGGLAGEIGHASVADSPICVCGGRGCLEAVSSAAAIAREYSRRTGTQVDQAREVADRLTAGDPIAREVWDAAIDGLALGLSHAISLVAPQAIVIGGGLSAAGPLLMTPLAERLDHLLTFHRRPELRLAQLGGDAGVIGAALLARAQLAGASGTTT